MTAYQHFPRTHLRWRQMTYKKRVTLNNVESVIYHPLSIKFAIDHAGQYP